jgi:hypothetical protein
MTRYAEPDIIACPHCQQRFSRHVMMSFTNYGQTTYSDGGSIGSLSDAIITVTRCTCCQHIIENIDDLEPINEKVDLPFWKKWFFKQDNYTYLPHASFDVYLEMFERAKKLSSKLDWAVLAYRKFNQSYRVSGNERLAQKDDQTSYRKITDFILANPTNPITDKYLLLCADIYRLRGEFLLSQQTYDKVINAQYRHIVVQGKNSCELGYTCIMAIESNAIPISTKEVV